ncbi:hypothetical protein DL764_000771 [Monosporascus ibericus]|uniref:Transcription factor domain-containing protein n=1 Tax=Monosporascus ibericus TaxID=155417 RepID=A0A4V1XCM6_9PEZI|nr:hypothetical protein DL764_000771 [Monosporascus ibericus]
MSDYYHQYLPLAGDNRDPQELDPQDVHNQPLTPAAPHGEADPQMPPQFQSLGYFTGFPDPILFQPSCRKGKRDCVYPEPPNPKGSTGPSPLRESSFSCRGSPDSDPDEAEEGTETGARLGSIPDEEPNQLPTPPAKCAARLQKTNTALAFDSEGSTRRSSETPSLEGTKSTSPSMSISTTASLTPYLQMPDSMLHISSGPLDWSDLPPDFKFYLEYFCSNISVGHYGMNHDPDNFFRGFLPGIAVRNGNDPLLNAVVGFAAYHYTVQNPKGKIQDFLQYYDRSVTLLLSSFRKREKQTIATLMTILQLATIEEYLGDWVSLMGHQKAAFKLLTQLFTPQTATQSSTSCTLLNWYVRFDVSVGMMAGFETTLPREWFSATVKFSVLRLISMDMSLLYAKGRRREISGEEFSAEYRRFTSRLYEWRNNLDPAITDSSYLVTDFGQKQPLKDDIVNPYQPGYLYDFPLFRTTTLIAEWNSVILMHNSQETMATQREPSNQLNDCAMEICKIFETVEKWPAAPKGVLMHLQPCLAIAALFLPRDSRHHMWVRRKYALIEKLGYIFPSTMRARMAEIFRDPTCEDWWLPNEEGLSPVLRSIRAFADERNANPVSEQTENVREMNAIFAKMRIDSVENRFPSPGDSSNPAH